MSAPVATWRVRRDSDNDTWHEFEDGQSAWAYAREQAYAFAGATPRQAVFIADPDGKFFQIYGHPESWFRFE